MNGLDAKDTTFISILERAFRIMERLLLSDTPMGVSQLSRDTGIPKANTFRILKTLEELGAVAPMEDGYVLGSKLLELGAGAKRQDNFLALAIPHIQKLAAACGETVNLGILFRDHVLMLHSESGEQYSLVASLPPVTPLYCSSIGKLFLAQMSREELAQYFADTQPQQRTVNTVITAEAFSSEQAEICCNGLACDREEYDYGLSCMAAPVFLDGALVAGISLSGPTSRLEFKGLPNLAAALKKTAQEMSAELTAKNAALPKIE